MNKLNTSDEIRQVVEQAEASGIDLAPSYDQWLKMGFALAGEAGEQGREAFLRLSRLHPGPQSIDPDRQYSICLSQGRGDVSISTFFYLAQQAGISVQPASRPLIQPPATLPTGPTPLPLSPLSPPPALVVPVGETDEADRALMEQIVSLLWASLLQGLQRLGRSLSERVLLLFSGLVCLSSTLRRLTLTYDGKRVGVNLYGFVVAPAASGKGIMAYAYLLVEEIQQERYEEGRKRREQYRAEMAEWEAKPKKERGPMPETPPQLLLRIPSNSSATAILQTLAENDGCALLFESEGDEVSQSFKSEHGDYSTTLRKAYHNEECSYKRRTDNEYVVIPRPLLSVMLSGTPGQVRKLTPERENGLFSRFLYFLLEGTTQWRDVFAQPGGGEVPEEVARRLGQSYTPFYHWLLEQEVDVQLSQEQALRFNDCFAQLLQEYSWLEAEGFAACIKRAGLSAFRMMAICTVLRLMDTPYQGTTLAAPLTPCDDDFRGVLLLTRLLLRHTCRVFVSYDPTGAYTSPQATGQTAAELFAQRLPPQFGRTDFLRLAEALGIHPRTAERYVQRLVEQKKLLHYAQNDYRKL